MSTMRVTMRDPMRSEDGLSVLSVGSTYTVTREYGAYLIARQAASDTDNIRPTILSPGDSAEAAKAAALPRGVGSRGLCWGYFGHSFMDNETVSGTSIIEGFTAVGTVNWANFLLDKPLRVAKELGIGGYRLLDMLALWPSISSGYKFAGLSISLGHNDLKGLYPAGNATAQALYPQQPADTQQTQLPYLLAKLKPWVRTVDPTTLIFLMGESPPGKDPSGSSAGTSATLATRFLQWNAGLRELARLFQNVVYVPADLGTIDPSSTTAMNQSLMLFDQVHPGILGSYQRGKIKAEALARVLPVHASPLPYSATDTHSNTALTTSSVPSAAANVLTVPLSNGSTLLTVQPGDWFQLQPVGTTAADKALAGRYQCTAATTTQITAACGATQNGNTASANMKVAISKQLFINPLFLTANGGNVGGFSNSGTINGSLPLGVDISNLPSGWTVTFSVEAHTRRDTRTGMTALTLSSVSVGSRTATATDSFFRSDDVGKLLVGPSGGAGIITAVTDGKTATVNVTTAFASTSVAALTWRVGTAGLGNWMRVDLNTGAGAAGFFNLNFQVSQKSAWPGAYDVFRKAHLGTTYQTGIEYMQQFCSAGFNGVDWNLYARYADIATETSGTIYTARDMYRDTSTSPNTASYPWPTDELRGTLLTPEVTFADSTGLNFLEV